MGLDMYLEVRKHVSLADFVTENNDFIKKENPEGKKLLKSVGLNKVASKEAYGVVVTTTAIYWRKVNAIHKWFVDHCAGGVDECQPSYLERSKLLTLRDQVDMVLRSKNEAVAQEWLPTESGFFFGSTEYGEYYWSDLEYTLKELDRVLKETEDDSVSFIYQASW